MIVLFTVCALVALTTLKVRAMEPRISPDGRAYLNLASRRLVPAPYCWRIGFPAATCVVSEVFALELRKTMMVMGYAGYLLSVPATIWLAMSMGASFTSAVGAAILLVLSIAGFAYPLSFPYLADCWGSTLAILSSALAVNGWGVWAMFPLIALGAIKESYLAFAAAFLFFVDPSLWWVALPGLAVHLSLRHKMPRIPPDPQTQAELTKPIQYVAGKKRYGVWFSFVKNTSQAGPLPYLFAWYAPAIPFLLPVLAVVVLAWLQAHVGTDHDRLIWQSLPWVAAALAVVLPVPVLALGCVLSMWWPWYKV